jgi:tRNA-Thr(GGU) m(6)t(6)A37 methyltransferase TsaA
VVLLSPLEKIRIHPIGFVKRSSSDDNVKDRGLVSKIVLKNKFARGLDGIEEWSHVYVIFWMHKISDKEKKLIHPGGGRNLGIFATRAPVRPNPIGLTLVELVKREGNVLWVRGLDALDDTPVLDIKPYPDWESGHPIVVEKFRIPKWLSKITK